MKCSECNTRLCIEGVCDYCLATMFDRGAKEVPVLRPEDTGQRTVPDPVADLIAQAKAAITQNRPPKGTK